MTNDLLKNSQNNSDLDETFTEASDGCCLKSNQTIPNKTKPTLNLKTSSDSYLSVLSKFIMNFRKSKEGKIDLPLSTPSEHYAE